MIKYLQLFGERCSGTNFVANLLNNNMGNVELTQDFGGKHWFIKGHHPRCRANQSTDYQCIRALSDSADTLFICVFRNPFDWLRSLHARPYHAANHMGLTLTEFLCKPWHSFETARLNPSWPDRKDQYWFIEEAKNILRLRTEKIQHLLKLQQRVEHICFIKYESLRDDSDQVGKLADQFRIKVKHPYILEERKHFGHPKNVEFSPRKHPPISAEDLEFIRRELNWEIEGRIGYHSGNYRD